jgi:hypothetical protein
VVEVAAGSAARVAGTAPQQFADCLGVSLRTVQGRYPYPQVHLDRPGAGPARSRRPRLPGTTAPVVLGLPLSTGKVSFAHQGAAPATGTLPGRVWRWPVPLLTGPGAATLLEVVAPLALRILTGTDTVDGARVADAQVGRVRPGRYHLPCADRGRRGHPVGRPRPGHHGGRAGSSGGRRSVPFP